MNKEKIGGVPKSAINVAIKKAAQGNHRAFRVLYNAFYENVKWFFILKRDCDDYTAGDLANEVMSKVWTNANQHNIIKAQVSTWVYSIAKNVFIDYVRREQTKKQFYAIYELFHTFDYTDDKKQEFNVHSLSRNPEQEFIENQKGELLNELFTEKVVGKNLLEIMKLRYVEQLSLKEVADKLNMNDSTVRVNIKRGRDMMREFVKSNHEMAQQFSL